MIINWAKPRKPGRMEHHRTPREHARDLLRYMLDPASNRGPDLHEFEAEVGRGERLVASGGRNFLTEDHREQLADMVALFGDRSGDASPLRHFVIAWSPDTHPTVAEAELAVEKFLTGVGLGEHQAIWALHGDREHTHVHVMASRIHPLDLRTHKIDFEIDALHRQAALLNHEFGHADAPNSLYYVDLIRGHLVRRASGEVIGADDRGARRHKSGPAVSSGAAREETMTGLRSADRVGAEHLWPIIERVLQTDPSWAAFHQAIAKEGWTYSIAPNRQGAVLTMLGAGPGEPDRHVRASAVHPTLSLKKLERRLGAFGERDCKIVVQPRRRPAMDGYDQDTVHALAKGKARKRVLQARRAALKIARKSEEDIVALTTRQRRRDAGLLTKLAFAGRRSERERVRADIARERRERLEEIERRYQPEIDAVEAEIRAADIASTIDELIKRKRVEHAAKKQARRFWSASGLDGRHEVHRPIDVPGFRSQINTHEETGADCVQYFRATRHFLSRRPDFIDAGQYVEVLTQADDTILGALQVAVEKFGEPIKVDGDDEFRRRAAELAGRRGVQVSDADLQEHWRRGRVQRLAEDALGGGQANEAASAVSTDRDLSGKPPGQPMGTASSPGAPRVAPGCGGGTETSFNPWVNEWNNHRATGRVPSALVSEAGARLVRHIDSIAAQPDVNQARYHPTRVLSAAAARLAATGHSREQIVIALHEIAPAVIPHRDHMLDFVVARTTEYAHSNAALRAVARDLPLEDLIRIEGRTHSTPPSDERPVAQPTEQLSTPTAIAKAPELHQGTDSSPTANAPSPIKTGYPADPHLADARTRAWPAVQRIARENPDWQAVHRILAEFGYEYRLKGDGAILRRVESTGAVIAELRPSKVARDMSLDRLIATLGPYQPPVPAAGTTPAPPAAAPITPVQVFAIGDKRQMRLFLDSTTAPQPIAIVDPDSAGWRLRWALFEIHTDRLLGLYRVTVAHRRTLTAPSSQRDALMLFEAAAGFELVRRQRKLTAEIVSLEVFDNATMQGIAAEHQKPPQGRPSIPHTVYDHRIVPLDDLLHRSNVPDWANAIPSLDPDFTLPMLDMVDRALARMSDRDLTQALNGSRSFRPESLFGRPDEREKEKLDGLELARRALQLELVMRRKRALGQQLDVADRAIDARQPLQSQIGQANEAAIERHLQMRATSRLVSPQPRKGDFSR